MSQATTTNNPNVPTQEIEEVTIAIAGNNLNPMMLTYEFLTSSGIIPQDWELTKQPVTSQRGSQLSFKNGVSILGQPGVVNFIEGISSKATTEVKSPQIALEYIEKLPHAEYQKVGISPKTIVPFSQTDPDGARKFITEVLLGSGPWKQIGNAPIQAGLNLSYQLEKSVLNLSINEAKIQLGDKTSMPALLFSGSFNYNLPEELNDEAKLGELKSKIGLWQEDLSIFRNIVKEKFLQKADTSAENQNLFPNM